MKYADVALLTKLKNSKDTLTYAIPESLSLSVGDFVIVPIRNAQTKACILSIHEHTPSYATKEVISKVDSEYPLPQHYLEMLSYISQKTFYSFNNLIASWIQTSTKKNVDSIDKLLQPSTYNLQPATHPRLALYSSQNELVKLLHASINSYAGQVIIIFPQVHRIESFLQTLTLDRNIYSSHKKLSVKQQYDQWQAAHIDGSGVFIGNRSLLTIPFANPAHIILIDDIADEHIQREPMPHYSTHQIAKFYESYAQVSYINLIPRIENLHRVAQKEMDFIQSHEEKVFDYTTSYISSHTTSQNSSFTDEVLEHIKTTIETKKQVLIFCNKKGLYTGLYCRDCKKSHKDIHFVHCPNCRSINLMPTGVGILQIEDELKKQFPDVSISTYSQDHTSDLSSSIIIATELILPQLSKLSLGMTVITSLDTLLFSLHTTQDELHLLTILSHFLLTQAPVYIQAQQEIPSSYQNILNKDYKHWYLEKIAERKQYKLSPFSNHIEITYKNKNSQRGVFEIKEIHTSIKNKLPMSCEITDILTSENLWSFEIITPSDFDNTKLAFIKDLPIKIYSLN